MNGITGLSIAVLCSGFLLLMGGEGRPFRTVVWNFNSVTYIGGKTPQVLGRPEVIQLPGRGRALLFDGLQDGIILDTNPLAGACSFSLEVIFRPDSQGAKEQRFIHMQASEDQRVLVETRLNDRNEWFLDTFIKSGLSERTLQSRQTLHPLGHWYHAALVYDRGTMRHFVNGVEEMSGAVEFAAVEGGQTSVGCRLNRVFWFKGALRVLRVTHRALKPAEFLKLENEELHDPRP